MSVCRGVPHGNIVRYLGTLKVRPRGGKPGDNRFYPCMELVEGPTFEQFKDEDIYTRRKCALHIGAALLFLHGNGTIHYDTRVRNILFRREENGSLSALLCDFGSARNLLFSDSEAPPKVSAGPREAKPPEYPDRVRPSGTKWDVYYYGVLLDHLLEGTPKKQDERKLIERYVPPAFQF